MGCGTSRPTKVHATERQPVIFFGLKSKRPTDTSPLIRNITIISNQSQDLFSTTHNKNKIIMSSFAPRKGTKNSIAEDGSNLSREEDDEESEDFDEQESHHKYYVKYASLVRDEDLDDIKEAEFCVTIIV